MKRIALSFLALIAGASLLFAAGTAQDLRIGQDGVGKPLWKTAQWPVSTTMQAAIDAAAALKTDKTTFNTYTSNGRMTDTRFGLHSTSLVNYSKTLKTADVISKGPLIDVRAFANLSTAKASSETAGKTILIATSTSINTATIPSDRALRIENGGSINVASGKTLTINGPVETGSYQVFPGSGTVIGLKKAEPEYFSVNTTPGTTDMTTALTKAIVAAAGTGKVILTNTYRTTAIVPVLSNTIIEGNGKILVDYTMSVNTGALEMRGTIGSAVLLTANVDDVNDVAVAVASNTGFAVGDLVAIGQTTVAALPITIMEVSALSSTTGISFDSPIGTAYTTANGAYVKKITPVSNVTIKDITFAQGGNSSYTYNYIYYSGAKNIAIDNIKAVDQQGNTAGVIGGDHGYNFVIQNNSATADVPFTDDDGWFCSINSTSKLRVINNMVTNYAFGIGVYNSEAAIISNNRLNANVIASPNGAVRAIKLYGSSFCSVTGNAVSGFESGVKVEGAYNNTITGNVFRNTSAHTINIGANSDPPVTLSQYNTVVGNQIYSAGTYGVYIASADTFNTVMSNEILNSVTSAYYIPNIGANIVRNNLIKETTYTTRLIDDYIYPLTANLDKTDTSLTYALFGSVLHVGYTYQFEAMLFITADGTGGYKISLNDGGMTLAGSPITYRVLASRSDTKAVTIDNTYTALNTAIAAVGGTSITLMVQGTIKVTTEGDLRLLFAQSSTSGTSTLLAGSYLKVSRVF